MSDFSLSSIFGQGSVWVGVGSAVLIATLTIGGMKSDIQNLKELQNSNFQDIKQQLADIKQQLNSIKK
jgi:hypothetical protein